MIVKSRSYFYGRLLLSFFLISPQWVVFSDRGFGLGLALFAAVLRVDFFSFSGNGRYVGITGARIPDKMRFNQVIFRYYALAETHRILSETIESLDTPRFLELLSADDKDKVLRLAAKLNEVEARSD